MDIRIATQADRPAIWRLLEPVIRAGETYPLDRDMSEADALGYWFASQHEVYVALIAGAPAGTYYLKPNQSGGGRHVANCGYVTAPAQSRRGVAEAMCRHSMDRARARGFKALQFNFVISTNDHAVKLWQKLGFKIAATLPGAFAHPRLGFVDAFVMFREL